MNQRREEYAIQIILYTKTHYEYYTVYPGVAENKPRLLLEPLFSAVYMGATLLFVADHHPG